MTTLFTLSFMIASAIFLQSMLIAQFKSVIITWEVEHWASVDASPVLFMSVSVNCIIDMG